MKIFSGAANTSLAEKIAQHLKIKLSNLEIHLFADEEKRVRVVDRVVGEDCIVVQSTSINADKNYMELFFVADALKRSGAKSVTAIISYLGYQRQDRVFRSGEAVSLEVIIKVLETVGIDKVIIFDLHSVRISELFHIPVIHLSALPIFAEKIKEVARGPVSLHPGLMSSPASPDVGTRRGSPALATPRMDDFFLVSPDMGGVRRIKILSKMLANMPFATIVKNRDLATGNISIEKIEGVLKKRAIIVDDMISTGSTIIAAVELLAKKGVEEIFVFATHPVFTGNAPKLLQESLVEKVFVTDTIDIQKEKQFEKLEVLSVAGMIATALKKNF